MKWSKIFNLTVFSTARPFFIVIYGPGFLGLSANCLKETKERIVAPRNRESLFSRQHTLLEQHPIRHMSSFSLATIIHSLTTKDKENAAML